MNLLDYIEDNWRDSYRPITRYPEIYGEHFERGKGLLSEEGQGWSSLYKKPMGLLNISGIPALYEALRDEPIRDNLINAGMDSDKAGYATQAIGTALDIGVPWAVMKKGMTPWMSEYAASKANPASKVNASPSDPSRRRFIQGAAGATALAATGKGMELLPAAKQVAKSAPKGFAGLLGKMTVSLKGIGRTSAAGPAIIKFGEKYGRLAHTLGHMRGSHIDSITSPHRGPSPKSTEKVREIYNQYQKQYPVEKSPKSVRKYFDGTHPDHTSEIERIREQVIEDLEISLGRDIGVDMEKPVYRPVGNERDGYQHWVPDHITAAFGQLERARLDYKADPVGFIKAMESKMEELRVSIARSSGPRHHVSPEHKLFSSSRKQMEDYDTYLHKIYKKKNLKLKNDSELLSQMEQFLKELQGG